MNRPPVQVQPGVFRPAQFQRGDFLPRLQAAFDGINRIPIRFFECFAPRKAARYRRHARSEHAVFVLEIVDGELLVFFHETTLHPLHRVIKRFADHDRGECFRSAVFGEPASNQRFVERLPQPGEFG